MSTEINIRHKVPLNILKILLALSLIAAIILSPKTSTWIAYSKNGAIIEGSSYQLCEMKARHIHGKCSYVNLLFGLGTGVTQSDPVLPDNFEGIKVESFQDGKCQVSAKTKHGSLVIVQEKNRSDPGSARSGMQKNIKNPVIFFSVENGSPPEQSLTYREPDDFIAWELKPFYGHFDSRYIGEGWFFSEQEDQIVRLNPIVHDEPNRKMILYERGDIFTNKEQVSSYESDIKSRAFKWRDEQLFEFGSTLNMSIPKDCNDFLKRQ
ncbi:hypothetical protein OU800_05900 [Pseudomonas sp. GOM7]|uniref:hypothetical protein n=1 Tax=Pseudomonas sp. GOM7 TaxID=2998079 RepID=UPI00227BA55F|nr:hypothetical protein [Pseudomonas sp. GOM7]WAJ38758.1 hypothetical protein OU800_05900 [Pseudomonas sp. GOM7]